MNTLHVCVLRDPKGKVSVLTEMTSGNREPRFMPTRTCDQYFSIKNNLNVGHGNPEDVYKIVLQDLYDQGFTITPPDK